MYFITGIKMETVSESTLKLKVSSNENSVKLKFKNRYIKTKISIKEAQTIKEGIFIIIHDFC